MAVSPCGNLLKGVLGVVRNTNLSNGDRGGNIAYSGNCPIIALLWKCGEYRQCMEHEGWSFSRGTMACVDFAVVPAT